ncbi:MAG: BNR-4 repeat-containing protein [Acidobacteriota bacterium]
MQPRLIVLSALVLGAASQPLPRDEGYGGIWYYNEPSKDQYKYKYSGGFATYPQQQGPIAHYSRQANKTFFVYGGTVKGKQELLHMVSYYDHATGKVPRPVILLNKKTEDAHDNPVMTMDAEGHLWIFSNAHGAARPSFIHRSKKPYSIDEFELVLTTNFSYGHAWFLPGAGFFFPHTRYTDKGRSLFWMASRDGREWSEPQLLARMAQGHYQITCQEGPRVATSFNHHPLGKGVNWRTNLYYLETTDLGKTWKTVDGRAVQPPLTSTRTPALVHDYESEKLLVYLKTVQFDAQDRPVIMYLTSKGYASGPANDPRQWRTARWTGKEWEIRDFTRSDHNYDFGSLYIEPDGTWRVIAPTAPGPQAYCTGGEMVLWTSRDQGKTWRLVKQLTRNSPRNHTYARKPVSAHPAFYALWADGDAKQPSESHLYFTDKAGAHVWRLPPVMTEDFARPEITQ